MGWCFRPLKISIVVTILRAAKIFGEELRYHQEFTLFVSVRGYNFIPLRFWMNRSYAYNIRMGIFIPLAFCLIFVVKAIA